MTGLVDDQLVGGLHRDLGLALARHLGRQAVFLLLPRKRMPAALERGDADLACHFRPQWLPGDFAWSAPFLPNALVALTNDQAAPPANVEDLAGKTVGTVLGFSYPEVATSLGAQFVRDDAPNAAGNLQKLKSGRVPYALVGDVFLKYQQMIGAVPHLKYAPLVIAEYKAQCAVSRHSRVTLSEVNRAIGEIKSSGELAAIYATYR